MNSIREMDIKRIISKMPYKFCQNKTFLITGAYGFLASYMVDTLMFLKKEGKVNCSVIALCRNKEKAQKAFREWLSYKEFYILEQPVEEKINIEEKVDYIIHAASYSATQLFEKKPVDLIEANVIGSYNMLELAKSKKVKGFLFFSSGAVYGNSSANVLDEQETYNINYLDMKNSYACGKRMGEALCRAFFQQYGVPTKGVRISHTYGPGINIDDGHVYSDFAKSIIAGKDIIVNGDGKATRPFCYVSDAISAFWLILFKGKSGEMYNMANSNEIVSIKELADILTQNVFRERGLKVIVRKEADSSDICRTRVNTAKLENLGWKPVVGLEEGFKRLICSLEEEGYEMEK